MKAWQTGRLASAFVGNLSAPGSYPHKPPGLGKAQASAFQQWLVNLCCWLGVRAQIIGTGFEVNTKDKMAFTSLGPVAMGRMPEAIRRTGLKEELSVG